MIKYYFLRFLGKIYQWTGIYLAKRWEKQFILENYKNQNHYYRWLNFRKDNPSLAKEFNFDEFVGMEIGCWQIAHGFYRKMKWYKK
jgi:hypothetical protein